MRKEMMFGLAFGCLCGVVGAVLYVITPLAAMAWVAAQIFFILGLWSKK